MSDLDETIRALRGNSWQDVMKQRKLEQWGPPRYQTPPYHMRPSYAQFPSSHNVEDRSQEPTPWGLTAATQLTGQTPEYWRRAIRHPLTPMSAYEAPLYPPLHYRQTDPLAVAAGVNQIAPDFGYAAELNHGNIGPTNGWPYR